ncbi:hypothetical protein ACFVFQ_37370 [Streptomyces sp. NPDC057743]|uniref:hypothetical protein n=1 Tax=Streptomyces sp. NPDC057743 TaxID=3346236 RepID=UPI0036985410
MEPAKVTEPDDFGALIEQHSEALARVVAPSVLRLLSAEGETIRHRTGARP